MTRHPRIITALALGSLSIVGWAALRQRFGPIRSVIHRAPTLLGRLMRSGDTQTARFEWTVRGNDQASVTAALDRSGGTFVSRWAANRPERAELLASKLTAVGMHFDEDSVSGNDDLNLARVAGAATAMQLASAIELVLESTPSGLIVDTTSNVVEIDQHPDLAHSEIVILEPHGAYQLRAGTRRALLRAIREATARGLPMGNPVGDLDKLRHELRDFPSTLDGLIDAVLHSRDGGAYLSYERAERLGAVRRCAECANPMVDVIAVSELIARYYGSWARRQEIVDALIKSGLETGDPFNLNLCSVHGQTKTVADELPLKRATLDS